MVVDESDDELDYTPLLGSLESVNLNFRVKDCDPNTQEVDDDEVGYDDGYALEEIDIVLSDYIQKIVKPDFSSSWNELGEESEAEEVYQLSSFKSIDEAVKNVVTFLGMQPCDRSDRVSATSDGRKLPSHTLYLSGIFRGSTEVLVRSKLAVNLNDPEAGVTMQISVRSGDPTVSSFIAASVA
jgi:coatomer protein complex subunit gamma